MTTDVPQLRIVDDDLWHQVKTRQAEMRRVTSNGDPKRFNQARRPKFLFSGLTQCAECGAGYVIYWRDRLACFGARSRGTCSNRLTVSRQEVEERVLVALRDKLMRRDLFEDFCREYVRELNRLRMEHRAGLSHGRQELAVVESRDPEIHSGHQGRRHGVVDQGRAPIARSQEGGTLVSPRRTGDAAAPASPNGRRLSREGR